ncbi:MAG: sensor histidine kinase [Chloroflexi bacterium]|nr:sensor histidine kinase [Chloroflexota bacterium]
MTFSAFFAADSRVPPSLRRALAAIAALPIFTKVLVANCVIVIAGAVVGTYVTTFIVRAQMGGRSIELAMLFAAIGTTVSVVVNFLVLKIALRPLDDITRTAEEIRKGHLQARVARDPFNDPQMETLRATLNAMLDRLDEHGARLQALSSQILKAQEEERLRIARELHDETAQALASLLVRQRAAERTHDPAALQRTMADLRALTSEALEGVRRMALELRPTMLDDLGLVAALEAFARQFAQRTGVRVDVRATGGPDRLPPEVELVIYRVVQEALSNVARHSGATHADVTLTTEPTRLVVTVTDDGRGFDPVAALDSRERSLGLFGMRERASLIDGRLTLTSAPGRGTSVHLEVDNPAA